MKKIFPNKTNLLILLLLVLLTTFLNWLIFSKQLNYGFRDVDWLVLYSFKQYSKFSLSNLLEQFKFLGVYIPEAYYVGLLEKIIGINFPQLHSMAHYFKILAAVAVYVLILKIFKRKLLAFIVSILYTISYTHAGVLFQLASGGYFLTTIFMVLFLISYNYSLFKTSNLRWFVVPGILLTITILLKPERMYPLVFLVILLEFFLIVLGRFKKNLWKISLKRVFLIFLPLIIFYIFYQTVSKMGPTGFSPNQFSINTNIRIESIMQGNLQLLLYPFSSLGSIFLYDDYWKILGLLNFQSLGSYITSLFFGPVIRLGIVTLIILAFIYKKPFKLTLFTFISIFVFGLVIYMININWQNINADVRVHFDANLLAIPAIFGFYISILGIIFTIGWIKNKDQRLIPLIIGPSFAALFIVLTWLPSDLQLAFMGPQRYLSIPSIGTGLFIAGLLVIIYDGIKDTRVVKNFAPIIFSLIIPLMVINYQVATKFFDYELTFAGLNGSEQVRMKNKFRQIIGKINQDEKSLFYFDETADKINGYFDEGTVIAGFEFWTKVNMDGSLNSFPEPGMMRTNIQCPEHTHQNCVSILKSGLAIVDGKRGIWYKDLIRGNKNNFYPLSNFYAVRFINKDIIDIRDEVIKEIGESVGN